MSLIRCLSFKWFSYTSAVDAFLDADRMLCCFPLPAFLEVSLISFIVIFELLACLSLEVSMVTQTQIAWLTFFPFETQEMVNMWNILDMTWITCYI